MAALNPNEYAWIIPPTSQFLDVNGKPLVGGYCVIYIHGTTGIPYTTYQNWEGTENPIEIPIDILGHAPAIGSVDYSYDLYVYDSLNALVYSRLNLGAYGDEGTFSIHTDPTLHGDGSVSDPLGVEKPEVIGGLVRGIVPESDNVHVRTYQYLSDGSIMVGIKVDETEYQAGPGIKIEDHTISLEDLGEFEGSLMVAEGTATSGTDLNTGMSVLKQEGDSVFVQQNVLKLNKGVYHVDAFIKFGAIVNANEYDLTFLGHNGAKLVYTFDNTYEHTEIINFSFDADITEDSTPLNLTLNLASAPGSYSMKLEAVHVMKVIMQSGINATEYNAGAGIEIDQSTKTIYANFNQVQKKLTPVGDNVSIDDEGNISVEPIAEVVELTQAALTARFETIQGLYDELEEGKQFVFVHDIEDNNRPGKAALYVSERLHNSQVPSSGYYITLCGIVWGGYGEPYHGAPTEFLVSYCKLENNLNPLFRGFQTKPFFTDWIGSGWGPGVYTEGQIAWYVESVSASTYRSVVLYRCILGYTATNASPLPKNDTTHWEEVKLIDLINELFDYSLTQSDWNQSDSSALDYIKNKPENLVQDPDYIHTDNNFTDTLKNKLDGIEDGAEVNVQADWNQSDSSADDYIKNKPLIGSNSVVTVVYGVSTYAEVNTAFINKQAIVIKESASDSEPKVPVSVYKDSHGYVHIDCIKYTGSNFIFKNSYQVTLQSVWSYSSTLMHRDEVMMITYGESVDTASIQSYVEAGCAIVLKIGSSIPFKLLPFYGVESPWLLTFRDIQASQDGKKLQAIDYKINRNTGAWTTTTTDLLEIQPGTVVLTTSSTAADIQTAIANGAVPLLKVGKYYFQMTQSDVVGSYYNYTFTRGTQGSGPYVYVISNNSSSGSPNTNGAWQAHDELLMQVDWNQTDATKPDHIKNRPDTLPLVEGTDIQIDEVNSQVVISSTAVPAHTASESGKILVVDSNGGLQWQNPQSSTQVQADWNQTDSAAVDYIKNKPSIPVIHTITL